MANLFIQSAYRNLDAKGRLLLPPEYRDALLAAGDGSFWLTIGLYGGLKAYMPADWEAIVEKLNSVWDQARFDALLVEDVSDEVAACHLDIAL